MGAPLTPVKRPSHATLQEAAHPQMRGYELVSERIDGLERFGSGVYVSVSLGKFGMPGVLFLFARILYVRDRLFP